MEYNRENLISLIRNHPVLWDPDSDDHRSLNKREDAASAIGNSFNPAKSKEFVLKEWNSIKIYYQSRVRDMLKKQSKTGVQKKPKWELYDQINEFLGHITIRPQAEAPAASSRPVRSKAAVPTQQHSASNSTAEKFDDFFADYEEPMNTTNPLVEESFASRNGFGTKMIVMSKQNVDDDIDSFLNSIRPTLKKLSVNEEIFEDVKFEINSLLHKKYKECRELIKEGFQFV